MNPDTIMRLIALNVEMEGALRVLAARHSDEAAAQARAALEQINALMAAAPEDMPAATPVETCGDFAGETMDTIAEEAPVETPGAEEPPTEEIPAVVSGEIPAEATVAVDEMPARRERPDLRRAFTLNDKFLFRRELFAGSDTEFGDTIDLLMTMDSLDEAREYLLHDLQWDADNAVVADFLAIVTNHFNYRGR